MAMPTPEQAERYAQTRREHAGIFNTLFAQVEAHHQFQDGVPGAVLAEQLISIDRMTVQSRTATARCLAALRVDD
jgi:hypothetical protein